MCQETKMPANNKMDEANTSGVPIPSTPRWSEIPSWRDHANSLEKLKAALQRIVGVEEIERGEQEIKGGPGRNPSHEHKLPVGDEDQRDGSRQTEQTK